MPIRSCKVLWISARHYCQTILKMLLHNVFHVTVNKKPVIFKVFFDIINMAARVENRSLEFTPKFIWTLLSLKWETDYGEVTTLEFFIFTNVSYCPQAFSFSIKTMTCLFAKKMFMKQWKIKYVLWTLSMSYFVVIKILVHNEICPEHMLHLVSFYTSNALNKRLILAKL